MIKKWNKYINEAKSMRTIRVLADGSRDLSTTRDDIKKRALELLEKNIDSVFNELHEEFKTGSGDIYPEQAAELDRLQESLAKLISTQVIQNIEDIKNIKSDTIDVDVLDDLDTEKDIKVGDDVLLVFNDFSGFSIYRGKISLPSSAPVDSRGIGFEIVKNGSKTWGALKDAKLAVKVDTYNDWCEPSKRIPD